MSFSMPKEHKFIHSLINLSNNAKIDTFLMYSFKHLLKHFTTNT